MSPRKQSGEELSKQQILQTAERQFEQSGYQKVSMRQIATELGCTHGAIYYHFKNKAELFYAIVERFFDKLNQRVDDVLHQSGDQHERLRDLFLSFISFGLDYQEHYELMFMLRNEEVDALTQEASNESYRHFASAVSTLTQQQLSISEIWAAFLSLHGFVSFYRGFVSSYQEASSAAEQHVAFLLRRIE